MRLEAEFDADATLTDTVRAVLARDDDDDDDGAAPLSGDGCGARCELRAVRRASGLNAIVSLDVTPSGRPRVRPDAALPWAVGRAGPARCLAT